MIFLKGPIVYELENKLKSFSIYYNHEFLLFIARFIYKKSNHLFCYNFTYSQFTLLLIISRIYNNNST